MCLLSQGKAGEAEEAMRVNVEARRRLLGANHVSTLEAMNNLAFTLIHQNKLEEAELLLRQVCDGCRETLGADHPRTTFVLANLGEVLMLRNKLEDAQQLYRDMWETTCRTRGQDHLESIRAGYWLNRLLRQMGQYDAAEAIGRQNVAAAHQSLSPEHTLRGETVIQLALTLRAQFRSDECLAIRTQALAPDHWLVAETDSLLGDCLARQGSYAEAEPLLIESFAAIAASGPSQPLRTIQALERIVDLYDRWGKPAEAERWRQELQVKLRDSEKN